MEKNGLGAVMLALLLVFGLAGCPDGGNSETPPPDADIIITGIPKTVNTKSVVSINLKVDFTNAGSPDTVLAAASIIGGLANGDPIDSIVTESDTTAKASLTLYKADEANDYYNNGANSSAGKKPMPSKKPATGNGTVEAEIRAITDIATFATELVGKKQWNGQEFKSNLVLKWDEGTNVSLTP